jgi:branched-chain amino acid transport system permease protein
MSLTSQSAPTVSTEGHRGKSLRRDGLALLVIAVIAAFVPMILPAEQQSVAVRVLIFALMALGWNLMSGFGGMFSFGHAAYFGIGAYADTYLLVNHNISPWISMVVGAVLAGAVAALIGFLAFRYKVRGAYFALATFAFAEMLRLLAANTEVVNGAVGYRVPLLPEQSWSMLQFDAGAPEYYWIGLALVVLAVLVTLFYLRSRSGRFTVAIRDDEEAAESLGIAVMRYKLTTMALSGGITAVAGAFYAQYYLFVDPDIAFGQQQSIQAILPAVVGGVGTVWGPLLGAAILGPLSDLTATLLRTPPEFLSFLQGRNGLDVMLYAILLIVIVLVLPKGLYGTLRDRWRS